jgi:hypothetical protein
VSTSSSSNNDRSACNLAWEVASIVHELTSQNGLEYQRNVLDKLLQLVLQHAMLEYVVNHIKLEQYCATICKHYYKIGL